MSEPPQPPNPPADPPADPPAPPEPPPPPEPKGHWTDQLDGDVRGHPGLSKFADPTSLGRGYLELEAAMSRQGTRVPGKDASAEEWARYRKAIGVPEKPDGYNFDTAVEVPEGFERDAEFESQMLGVMHEAGLTPEQVAKVGQAFVSHQGERFQSELSNAQNAKAEAQKILKREWGSAYDAKIRGANVALDVLFGENKTMIATTRLADGTMLGVHPAFVRAMAKVGEDYEEHNIHGVGDRKRMTMTPQEAAQELAKLEGDSEFQQALYNVDDPGHARAVQRRNDLYAMKAAGGGG